MTTINGLNVEQADREVTFSRLFEAPRELVFRVLSEPQHVAQWWGPAGWTVPVCEIDFRPGGVWRYCLRGPAGEEKWVRAVYQEIVKPERIVYLNTACDTAGHAVEQDAAVPDTLVTVSLEDRDGRTLLTSHTIFATADSLQASLAVGMVPGTAESWQHLADYLTHPKGARS